MAEILSNVSKVKLIYEVASENEKKSFNPMSNSSLENTHLKELHWTGCFNARKGFKHTVSILKESL